MRAYPFPTPKRLRITTAVERLNYQDLFELAPTGHLVLGQEGRILAANRRAAQILGLSQSALRGEPFLRFVFPEDRHLYDQLVRRMHQAPKPQPFELRLKKEDGLVFWSELVGSLSLPEGGDTVCQLAIHEITVRKQKEQYLALFKSIIEKSSEAIAITNAKGRVVYVNPAHEKLFGRPLQEALQQSYQDYLPPESIRRLAKEAIPALQKGQGWQGEMEAYDATGRKFLLWERTDSILDESGQMTYAFGLMHDITELRKAKEDLQEAHDLLEQKVEERTARLQQTLEAHRKAQEDLQESKDLFDLFLRHSPIYAYIKEVSPQRSVTLRASENFREMIGISVEEMIGRPMEDLFPADLAARMTADDWTVVCEGRILKTEEEFNGRFYSTIKFPIILGEKTYLAGYSIDITDRRRSMETLQESCRQLESAMALANKMASQARMANLAKSRFLANMSHEIRTPLNAILGFSQLMRHDPELSAAHKGRVEIINRNGEHLLSLLNDTLELSKVEAGRISLTPVHFDLHALLNDLSIVFRNRAWSKGLDFETEIGDTVPRFLIADEQKLRQILINLLGNAVKFTRNGSVRLLSRVEYPILDSSGTLLLVVQVEDTGPGIRREEIHLLFQAFEQTSTGVKAEQGSGLGLAISRQFAQLMGGTITVESHIGKGTTFRLEIPAREGRLETAGQPPERRLVLCVAPGQEPCRVLVAEDDEDSRLLLTQMLTGAGFEVLAADDGNQAVEKFMNQQPALILMDLHMPGLDGHSAIRKIRSLPHGDEVRIIAVTAFAVEDIRVQCLNLGADEFLAKPFRQSELFEKIRQMTGIRYIYAETADQEEAATERSLVLTRASMKKLSPELKSRIREEITRGRYHRILEAIREIEAVDPVLYDALLAMVQRYNYESLRKYLDEN